MRRLAAVAAPFLVLVCLLCPSLVRAAVVDLSGQAGAVYIAPAVEMLADPAGTLTIDTVAASRDFVPFARFRDTRAVHWLRLSYLAPHPAEPWYLFLGYKADIADLYVPSGAHTYVVSHSGVAVPYAERPVNLLGAVAFAVAPAATAQTMYVRVRSVEPDLTIGFDSASLLWTINQFNLILIAGLDSILLALLVSSLVLFAMSRTALYAVYAGYLLAELISRSNEIGLAAILLWPHWAISDIRLDVIFDGLRVLMAAIVVRSFLRMKVHSPILDRINLAVAAVAGAYALAALLGVPFPASWSWQFALVYVPVWLLCALVAWRKGERRAPLLVIAWSALMLFSISFALKQLFGIGRGNLLAELIISHGSYFGVAIQTVFLSLAFSTDLRRLTSAKDRYEKLATVDGLTEISNRRAFDEALIAEWNRASRNRRPISLLMIDVDWFKLYNDTYGHGAGDESLRMVAQTGEAVMRKSGERFARYGGEEFAAILPDADEASALRVAQRVRDAVAAQRTMHERSPFGIVTVSIGVVTERPLVGTLPEDLLERADRALYMAKQSGRNTVSVDDTPKTPATFRP